MTNMAMKDAELDMVTGGTAAQTEELFGLFEQITATGKGEVSDTIKKYTTANMPSSMAVEGMLKAVGIDSHCTGGKNAANVYSMNGKTMSQADVVKYIKGL